MTWTYWGYGFATIWSSRDFTFNLQQTDTDIFKVLWLSSINCCFGVFFYNILVQLLRAKICPWISPATFCYQHKGTLIEAVSSSPQKASVYNFMQNPSTFFITTLSTKMTVMLLLDICGLKGEEGGIILLCAVGLQLRYVKTTIYILFRHQTQCSWRILFYLIWMNSWQIFHLFSGHSSLIFHDQDYRTKYRNQESKAHLNLK